MFCYALGVLHRKLPSEIGFLLLCFNFLPIDSRMSTRLCLHQNMLHVCIFRHWRKVFGAFLAYHINTLRYPPDVILSQKERASEPPGHLILTFLTMEKDHPDHDFKRVTYVSLRLDEYDPSRDTVTFSIPYTNIGGDWPLEKFFDWFYLTPEKRKEVKIFDLVVARNSIKCLDYSFKNDSCGVLYRRGGLCKEFMSLAELIAAKGLWEMKAYK